MTAAPATGAPDPGASPSADTDPTATVGLARRWAHLAAAASRADEGETRTVTRWRVGVVDSGAREAAEDAALSSAEERAWGEGGASSDVFAPRAWRAGERTTAPGGSAPYFELRTLLGRGGMGEVWEGWQASLGRLVAVKRLLPETLATLDDAELRGAIAAFRQEAATAAALEHPGIVPVHDLGLDERGRPIIAMKLVRGRRWADQLEEDRARMDEGAFLARHLPVLIDAAQAVAFAHSRGILHRDLKPSQVMTGEFGETLLMDWGLAVVFDEAKLGTVEGAVRPVDLPTLATATNPAGTPALMAPEQTLEARDALGPWTDVYLLGATLYFLLCGRYPHQTSSAAASMVRARVGVVEAPSRVAPQREVPGDLERLCLRMLAADPSQRPQTVREVIGALEDHLTGASRRREAEALVAEIETARAGLPVRASYDVLSGLLAKAEHAITLAPDTARYVRIRADIKRRFAHAAIAAGDLALARLHAERIVLDDVREAVVADVARAEDRARRHERQRRLFRRVAVAAVSAALVGGALFSVSLHRARGEAEERRRAADQQRLLSESRAAETRDLLAFLVEELSRDFDLRSPRDRALRDALAGRVLRHYEGLDLALDSDDAVADQVLAMVDLAASLANMGLTEQAARLLARARDVEAARLPARPVVRACRLWGEGYLVFLAGDLQGAAALLRESAATWADASTPHDPHIYQTLMLLAHLEKSLGDARRAEDLLRSALELLPREAAPLRDELGLRVRSELAELLSREDRAAEAEDLFRDVLAGWRHLRGEEAWEVALVLNNFGDLLRRTGRAAEAEENFRRALGIARRTRGERHELVATLLGNLGLLLTDAGHADEAEPILRQALALDEELLGPAHPNLALRLNALGLLLSDTGRHAEAVALLERALAIDLATFGEQSGRVATRLNNLAFAHGAAGDLARAAEAYRRLVVVDEAVEGPRSPVLVGDLLRLGRTTLALGEAEEAERAALRALEILRLHGDDAPSPEAASLRALLGSVHAARGDVAAARAELATARDLFAAALGAEHPRTRAAEEALARLDPVAITPAAPAPTPAPTPAP